LIVINILRDNIKNEEAEAKFIEANYKTLAQKVYFSLSALTKFIVVI